MAEDEVGVPLPASAAARVPSGSVAARRVASGTRWSKSSTRRRPVVRSSSRRASGPCPSPRSTSREWQPRSTGSSELDRVLERRAGPRIGHPGRRRAGRRQVDPAAAGGLGGGQVGRRRRSTSRPRSPPSRSGCGPSGWAPWPRASTWPARPPCPTCWPRSTRSSPTCWWSTRSRPSTSPSSARRPGRWPRCASARPGWCSEAKARGMATVLVGHVTKDGGLAGPRVLEHVVDTVVSFEGDRHHALRLLRATKHRFGTTDELGLFEMTEGGLPAGARRQRPVPGRPPRRACRARSWCPPSRGSGPLLVEVQGLVVKSHAPAPRALGAGARRRPPADAAGRAGPAGRHRPGRSRRLRAWPWAACKLAEPGVDLGRGPGAGLVAVRPWPCPTGWWRSARSAWAASCARCRSARGG